MRIEDELKSKFKNEYHKLLVNLHLTTSRLDEKFHEKLKEYQLSKAQFNVLRILRGQNGNPVSIGLIKERVIERNADMSRLIDRLFKRGLIERSECEKDRRQKDVKISQAGMELLASIDKLEDSLGEDLSFFAIEDAKHLNNLLDELRAGISSTQ